MPISIITRIKGRSLGMGTGGSGASGGGGGGPTPTYPSYDAAAGTQNCKKNLAFTVPSTVRLDPSVFDVPGTFTLFRYSTFSVSSGNTPQQQLNAFLTVDGSLLTRVTVLDPHGTIDTAAKTISVTLVGV